jgi:hypothetical protein
VEIIVNRPDGGPEREWHPGGVQQPSARVPLSSHLILVGVMVLFFAVAMDIVFDAPWAWWILPVLAAVPIVIGATQKQNERRRRAEQEGPWEDDVQR